MKGEETWGACHGQLEPEMEQNSISQVNQVHYVNLKSW